MVEIRIQCVCVATQNDMQWCCRSDQGISHGCRTVYCHLNFSQLVTDTIKTYYYHRGVNTETAILQDKFDLGDDHSVYDHYLSPTSAADRVYVSYDLHYYSI